MQEPVYVSSVRVWKICLILVDGKIKERHNQGFSLSRTQVKYVIARKIQAKHRKNHLPKDIKFTKNRQK